LRGRVRLVDDESEPPSSRDLRREEPPLEVGPPTCLANTLERGPLLQVLLRPRVVVPLPGDDLRRGLPKPPAHDRRAQAAHPTLWRFQRCRSSNSTPSASTTSSSAKAETSSGSPAAAGSARTGTPGRSPTSSRTSGTRPSTTGASAGRRARSPS